MSLYDRLVGADGGKNLNAASARTAPSTGVSKQYLDVAAAYNTSTSEYWQLLAARDHLLRRLSSSA